MMRHEARWGAAMLLVGLGAGALAAEPVVPDRSASLEYRVKAAYLLNFARYVEWPETAFASQSEPLSICLVGDDPFGTVLDRTLQGHVIGKRTIVARRLTSAEEAEGCHIIYVASAADSAAGRAIDMLSGRLALTVGESSAFLAAGGMVRFLIVDDTVRFEVNMTAAQRAGLRISSRMLSFAWAVHPRG